jgi:two-component system cell cycle response regulator CtrA
MRILLIEDDSAVAQAVELMLKTESFNVYATDLGEEGADLAKLYDYDAVVLDTTLPDISGFEVIRQIRAARIMTPILVLSAICGIEDKVKALGSGADDFMAKPFHKDELVARLLALVRRSRGLAENVITTGNLSLNLHTKSMAIAGQDVSLTGKEYQMIELLSLRKGMTISKDAFMAHLYGGMDEPELKIVDVFICKLRKKLALYNGHPIETVWGRGYVLRDAKGGGSVSMASEVASMADEPPVFVSRMSHAEVVAKFAGDRKTAPVRA